VSKRAHFTNLPAQENYVPTAPPADFITASRMTMGGIDFDPYSTPLNNTLIVARSFFDLKKMSLQEILQAEWAAGGKGRTHVFCPFGMDPNRRMLHKTLAEYRAGRVSEATFLVTNPETACKCPWVWDFPICIPFRRPRLQWWDDELGRFATYNPPTWGFLVYFPPQDNTAFLKGLNRFHTAFSPIGRIVFNEFCGDQGWLRDYRATYGKDFVFQRT
jgi:hypothetical protein